MEGLDLPFEMRTKEVDEAFSSELKGGDIPLYLCKKKAAAFRDELTPTDILITADTVVWLGDRVFNKPESTDEAVEMVLALSGRSHTVFTAVCLSTVLSESAFVDAATVYFGNVTKAEAAAYVSKYQPFDKAGSYGIQEWIGYMAIEKIEGSFYTVMGLPTHRLYAELKAILAL